MRQGLTLYQEAYYLSDNLCRIIAFCSFPKQDSSRYLYIRSEIRQIVSLSLIQINIIMTSHKQKKIETADQTLLVEGVSKKITKQFQRILQDFEETFKSTGEHKNHDYRRLCDSIEEMTISANDCYRLFIGDEKGITVNSRNPYLLIRYVHLFLTSLVDIRKQEIRQREEKKRQNDSAMACYNPNNIYELVARKNIQLAEMETLIVELKNKLELATQRAVVAEEMTQSVKQLSDDTLKVYRQNYIKMSEFLKAAEQKQTELLQSNRLLNEQIQTINMEFDIYKKNFKKRNHSGDKEKRLKQRLQKQYQDKVAYVTKQIEYQYRCKPN